MTQQSDLEIFRKLVTLDLHFHNGVPLHRCHCQEIKDLGDKINNKIKLAEGMAKTALGNYFWNLQQKEQELIEFVECYDKNLESIPLSVRYQFAKILEKYNK